MSRLPITAPATTAAAFAHINAVKAPTIDDLKLMVFLEASGLSGYNGLAANSDNAEIAALLQANGREELAHAHRVAQVITLLSGEAFPPPADSENPYVAASAPPLTRALLEGLVRAETNGDDLYESWAASLDNADAAALLRQNGREEIRHAERAAKALALLG